ncbi:MAG: hypothetical protein Q7U28_06710 [Aquabacterium sp.]|nr:hypothetical protein [Aquabacterium sp.]
MNTKVIKNKADLLFGVLQLLCLLSIGAQVLIDYRYDNVISVTMVGLSTSALIQYLWRSGAAITHPVSSLALFGMCITSQFASLLIQTFDGQPFVQLLRNPVLTFFVLAVVHAVGILTHWAYRHLAAFQGFTQGIAKHVLSPLNVHAVPDTLTVWLLSLVGQYAFLSGQVEMGDSGGKFIAALAFLMWMPFLIPLYHKLYGEAYCSIKKQMPLILAYAFFIATVAIVKNFRQVMFIGPLQGVIIYFIYCLRDPTPVTLGTVKKLIAAFLGGLVLIWAVTDLATAMVLVRDKRDKASAREMIEETIKAVADKTEIRKYREAKDLDAVVAMYDEAYLHNPVLARFSETKFHDNMLFYSDALTDAQRTEILELSMLRTVLLLPQDLLDALDIKLDKSKYIYSMGDVYINMNHGAEMGSFVTGSVWADMYAMSGVWFPFTCALLFWFAYVVFDAMSRFDGRHFISPAALCTSWPIFIYGLGGESFSAKVGLLIREIPQRLLLYALCYALIGVLLSAFLPRYRRRLDLDGI